MSEISIWSVKDENSCHDVVTLKILFRSFELGILAIIINFLKSCSHEWGLNMTKNPVKLHNQTVATCLPQGRLAQIHSLHLFQFIVTIYEMNIMLN